eukprot:scaffold154624_cov33-Tisochrysis_lutea.AAC.3
MERLAARPLRARQSPLRKKHSSNLSAAALPRELCSTECGRPSHCAQACVHGGWAPDTSSICDARDAKSEISIVARHAPSRWRLYGHGTAGIRQAVQPHLCAFGPHSMLAGADAAATKAAECFVGGSNSDLSWTNGAAGTGHRLRRRAHSEGRARGGCNVGRKRGERWTQGLEVAAPNAFYSSRPKTPCARSRAARLESAAHERQQRRAKTENAGWATHVPPLSSMLADSTVSSSASNNVCAAKDDESDALSPSDGSGSSRMGRSARLRDGAGEGRTRGLGGIADMLIKWLWAGSDIARSSPPP